MTPERIAAIREQHRPKPHLDYTDCALCFEEYPCELAAAVAQVEQLKAALICVGDKHPDGGLCWCPGDWPRNDDQPHAKACQRAREALAGQTAAPPSGQPWCTEDRHIVLPSGEACVCGENRMELLL